MVRCFTQHCAARLSNRCTMLCLERSRVKEEQEQQYTALASLLCHPSAAAAAPLKVSISLGVSRLLLFFFVATQILPALACCLAWQLNLGEETTFTLMKRFNGLAASGVDGDCRQRNLRRWAGGGAASGVQRSLSQNQLSRLLEPCRQAFLKAVSPCFPTYDLI